LGPLQDHDPPLTGCGPMVIAVEVELTVALVSANQVPLTEMYPVIAVGVQPPLVGALMVKAWVLVQPAVLV
jgi:hypothetical protein